MMQDTVEAAEASGALKIDERTDTAVQYFHID